MSRVLLKAAIIACRARIAGCVGVALVLLLSGQWLDVALAWSCAGWPACIVSQLSEDE